METNLIIAIGCFAVMARIAWSFWNGRLYNILLWVIIIFMVVYAAAFFFNYRPLYWNQIFTDTISPIFETPKQAVYAIAGVLVALTGVNLIKKQGRKK